MNKSAVPAKETEKLLTILQSPEIKDNPYNFAMFAFQWGKKNSPLEHMKGPREWQKEELLEMAKFIKENKDRMAQGLEPKTYHLAVSSGRGPGKSALVAMICNWMISCQMGSSTVVTANTDSQLKTRTFAEIGKWNTLSINNYWFERTQKGLEPAGWLAEGMKKARNIDNQYWYVKGELWSEDNPDSFAGAHNDLGELIIFDEASGIPQPIWSVTEGIFTEWTPYKFFLVFSNPRSNQGPFFDCFHDHREYWRARKINALMVEGMPHDTHEQIIKKYGIDSYEAKVEVLGEFPDHGEKQFISREVVNMATVRELERYDDYAPLCMGVDVARFGDDSTVIRFRRGRDARSIPPIVLKGMDNMVVANTVAELIEKYDPDGVFIDGGAGAGVIDRLKEMRYKVHEVQFGSASGDPVYFDHRTEMWAKMKEWLQGGMIGGSGSEVDKRLVADLVGPEYEFFGKKQQWKLESKESLKSRGLKSPDHADALALTFSRPVASRQLRASRRGNHGRPKTTGVGCDIEFG